MLFSGFPVLHQLPDTSELRVPMSRNLYPRFTVDLIFTNFQVQILSLVTPRCAIVNALNASPAFLTVCSTAQPDA